MRSLRAAVAAALFAGLLAAPSVLGFGTINGAGQRAEHERITRASLACAGAAASTCFEPRSIANLAGESGTFGAVGAPDSDEIFNGAAHCDNADFLATAGYPQSRADASAELLACRAHLRARFMQGVNAAARLLDDKGRIKKDEVDLSSSCTFTGGVSGRAKCDVLEGLGRALHGAEDFYSHSNFADQADPARPAGVDNPPGLGSGGVAAVLALRPTVAGAIPPTLSTGCFSLVPFGCRNRVTHGVLNKDEGLIDPASGAASDPRTPRGRIGTNFAAAVAGAIAEARRQWADMSAELVSRYGAAKGNLMICAITRDDPLKSCTGRRVAIVIDSSGSNTETDPSNLRIVAGQALNAGLISQAEAATDELPDQSAVVDFDNSARLVSPLADPDAASFAGIDSAGGTDIGSGVSLAIAELTKDPAATVKDRSGIVVLTDGLDGGTSLPGALAQAAALGIRVNFGFLSPPEVPVAAAARAAQQQQQPFTPSPELVQAIAATGGLYSVIANAAAQQAFVGLVQRSGVTNLEDPNGSDSGGPLGLGVSSTGVLTAVGDINTHEYRTRPWRPVTFTVRGLSGQRLSIAVRNVRSGATLASATPDAGATATLPAQATSGEFAVDVMAVEGTGAYEISVTESGVDLAGTPAADTLTCTDAPTFVFAAGGNDTVTCGAASDAIRAGAGADRVNAGAGDDVLIVGRSDVRRGTERLDGGAGFDRALFLFSRPRGTRCRGDTLSRIRVGRRGRVRLAGIEQVQFQYSPCSTPPVRPLNLSTTAASSQSRRPPKPRLRIGKVGRRSVRIRVSVARATAVMVAGQLSVGRRRVVLGPLFRNATRRQTLPFRLVLPKPRRGKLIVTALTAGVAGGATRSASARRTL